MRRGLRRPLLLALGVVAVAGLALSFPLFVFPRTEPPERADAVVVFADGRARRIATGARLVAEGVAPVLVISDGGGADSLEARACRRGVGVPAVCVTPIPAPPTARRGRSPGWPPSGAGARWCWSPPGTTCAGRPC